MLWKADMRSPSLRMLCVHFLGSDVGPLVGLDLSVDSVDGPVVLQRVVGVWHLRDLDLRSSVTSSLNVRSPSFATNILRGK